MRIKLKIYEKKIHDFSRIVIMIRSKSKTDEKTEYFEKKVSKRK